MKRFLPIIKGKYCRVATILASFMISLSLSFWGIMIGDVYHDIILELHDLAIYTPLSLACILASLWISDKVFFGQIDNMKMEMSNGR